LEESRKFDIDKRKHGTTEDEMRACEKSWVEYTTQKKCSNEQLRK
jgi:hypothetical protein